MIFRLPIIEGIIQAAFVRQGSTCDDYASKRESNLKDRIPFRRAKALCHAHPHTRLRSATRLTGFLPVSAKAGAGTFHDGPLNRSEWRLEMQRGVQGRIPRTRDNRSEARGCERRERVLGRRPPADSLARCSSRGFSGLPVREVKRCGSIPSLSFIASTECPRGVLRSFLSPTTRVSPSEGRGSEVQYKASQ